jgi:diaminobutyrate-2-oxoglutarate transaminase
VTLSKSISGYGLPMALLLIKPAHDIWRPAEHNGTFRGNNHAFVTARIALEKFWFDGALMEQVAHKAKIITERLQRIADLVPDARLKGRGMMQGVDVASGGLAEVICRRAFADGLIIETSGPNHEVIKILAALTIPEAELKQGFDILENAVKITMDARTRAAAA